MVGIKLGAVNNEINHVKLGPAQALIQSVKEGVLCKCFFS
jgi:regulator of sigma E protease